MDSICQVWPADLLQRLTLLMAHCNGACLASAVGAGAQGGCRVFDLFMQIPKRSCGGKHLLTGSAALQTAGCPSPARSRLQLQPWERPMLCMQQCSETAICSITPAGTAAGTAAESAGAVCPQHQPLTMMQVRDQIMRERAEGRSEATPQPIPRPGQQVDIKVSRGSEDAGRDLECACVGQV